MTEALNSAANGAETAADAPLALPAEQDGNALSAAEAAYFATRGESGLPQAAEDSAEAERAELRHNKTVPHGALHAEREEHKKTRAELQKMRAQALDWQRELASFQHGSRQQNMAAVEAAPPDPREDFLGFARWQGQEISRLSQELSAQQYQVEEKQRFEAAETAIMQEWDRAVSEARQDAPDIDEALDFLEEARMSQLGVLAQLDPRFADKNFCEKQIYAELRDIVISTFQQGKNPAAAVYEIAKAYGYGRDETARMGKLQEASFAARSLTASTGKQAGDPFLLETVANMPEAEFAKWYERNKASFRSMFGG